MKKSILMILILAWVISSAANGAKSVTTCFEDHLREAIELNVDRQPRYSNLTGEESVWISRTWIFLEKIVLHTRFLFNPDDEGSIYEEAGIPIICSGFVSMSLVPTFSSRFNNQSPFGAWSQPETLRDLEKRVRLDLDRNQFRDAWQDVINEIEKLNIELRQNCTTRHLLESTARFLGQAEKFNAEALKKNLPSSLPLSKKIVLWQLRGLQGAQWVDEWASNIQKKGIPFLCNDVPPITFPYVN